MQVMKMNPIRRVVNLLQHMAKKIAEQGQQEVVSHHNVEFYCRSTVQELKKITRRAPSELRRRSPKSNEILSKHWDRVQKPGTLSCLVRPRDPEQTRSTV